MHPHALPKSRPVEASQQIRRRRKKETSNPALLPGPSPGPGNDDTCRMPASWLPRPGPWGIYINMDAVLRPLG